MPLLFRKAHSQPQANPNSSPEPSTMFRGRLFMFVNEIEWLPRLGATDQFGGGEGDGCSEGSTLDASGLSGDVCR